MKFAMLSDTHYISRRLIADKDDKELMLQPAVTEQAILQAASESDVLFIIGDLTDQGDRYSHEDFSAILKAVKSAGKKVYVTFATHDFHHHHAYVRKLGEKVEYKTKPWEQPYFDKDNICWHDLVTDEFASLGEEECTPQLVDALAPEEIWEMYRDFGPDEAYSINEASFSYCLDLDENTRCLMLNDIFRNEEALRDKSPTYSPSCLRWIKQMLDEAVRDGKFIFACSHHPMLPAVPVHRIGAGTGNRDMRSPVVGHMLADMGINLIFTGHSHFCDVGYLKSEADNWICDITTPSVRFYPPAFRMVDLDGKAGKIKYDCTYINTPSGHKIDEESLFEHYHRIFYNQYYQSVTGSSSFVKKFMDKTTVKDIHFLIKNTAKLTPEEFESIKDTKLFDLIIETAFNMLIGDGKYTPDTPEYKVMMSISAKLDSILDAQPFVDIKKKSLGGYSIKEIIEPMLYNNSVPDREGEINFAKAPTFAEAPIKYNSHFGDVLMVIVWILAVILSPLLPLAVLIGIPVLVIKKKSKLKNNPDGLMYKYR